MTLAISVILIFLLGPIGDHQRIARQAIAALLLVGNAGAYRYSGDYFSPNPNPLVHTWSLSVEEQIYIFLPLILMLILRNNRNPKKITAVVFGCITALSFISFSFPIFLQPLYSRAGLDFASQFSFYSPTDRIWQFTVGGLSFLLLDRYQNYIRNLPKGLHLLGIVATITILFGPIHTSLKVGSLLASLAGVFLILCRSLQLLPNFLTNKLEWVGDRSYSIYLVHMPLLYLAKYSPALQIGNAENRIIQKIFAVVASLLFGSMIYSMIENRFRVKGMSNQLSWKSISNSLILGFLIPIVMFVGLDRSTTYGIQNNGLPEPNKTRPWDWDKDCQFFSNVNLESEPCKYGNHNSGESILLMGDSHAASISRAIISLGYYNNLDTHIKTFPGCGFVLSNKDFKPFYSYPYLTTECLQYNQSMLGFIKNFKPTIIIYMHRSSSTMVSPNNAKSRIQYNEMIAKSLEVLMEEETKVIHIGSTPEFLLITTRIQGALGATSKFSRIPFEDNKFWQNKGVTTYYLSTLGIFCPGEICSNKFTKDWLFHDADHLSEIGANRLIPELDPLIKIILSKKP